MKKRLCLTICFLLAFQIITIAQLDKRYFRGRIAVKQSELFPDKFINLRKKYFYKHQLLREKKVISILMSVNNPEINLQLNRVTRYNKIKNTGVIVGIPTAIAGGCFIFSGLFYGVELFLPRANDDVVIGNQRIALGAGIAAISLTSFAISTTYSIKNRKATKRAVNIYNLKY